MSAPFTMASAGDLFKKLMDKWEEALQITIKTGYWKDTEACDRIVAGYGDSIAEAISSGKFSGDTKRALEAWTNVTTAEANYRREQTEFVRSQIAPPDPNVWWMVLECHPHAPPEDVRKAFREKIKECHPDSVTGMAPQIRQLANEMAQKLTRAMREYEAKAVE
jgi:hypothetical protein